MSLCWKCVYIQYPIILLYILADEEATLSDEAKLAALEEAAATKAAEEDEAARLSHKIMIFC